ncbi:MAG: efflux RND transporter periplasmic adaptor subunit [Chitinophagaceae bacterium]|nr:efflux RND transporter periplasmic adaptor subunit [Chitinophagaceae bacterium]
MAQSRLLKTPRFLSAGLILSIYIIAYSCTSTSASDQKSAPAAMPVEVLTVKQEPTTVFKEYTAALEGKVNVEIRPQVDGYLDKIFVDEGAYVKAGQPLFRINPLPYQEQLNTALAGVHSAEAAVANAQLEIDKLTPLVENKVISGFQLKTAQSAFNAAKANLEQSRATAASARINVGFTLIKAPVNGYIGRLPKKTGSLSTRNDPEALTTLSNVEEVYAYFTMGETDFISFKERYTGNSIDEKIRKLPAVSLVLADNSEHTQKGKIDMVDGQFNKNTGAITLRAVFPNPNGLLRSGNTGKVRLSQQYDLALLIPQASTIELQDKIFVYLVGDSNKVNKQPVIASGVSDGNYIIKEGLKPGDRIVLTGIDRLQPGAAILPQTTTDSLRK